MKKGLLLALIILLAFVSVAQAKSLEAKKTPTLEQNHKMILCYPGWPSGWFRSECYGEDGGWQLLKEYEIHLDWPSP